MKVLRIYLLRLGWVGLLAIGCQPANFLNLAWSSPPIVSVAEISQRKGDRIIAIKGRVIARVPFIDSGSYQIQDATGTVWILTKNPLPNIGEEVTIKGQIEYQAIPIGGQDIGEFYVLELEKMATAAANPAALPVAETSKPPVPGPPTVKVPAQPTPPPETAIAPKPKPAPPETPKPATVAPPKPQSEAVSSQPAIARPASDKPASETKSAPLNLSDLYFPHKRNAK